ncbi:probable glutathione S-transferase [Gossypium arboreum]|uniref:probable glutathione S-transferase n=1 Tax=Gossypium arboreum TaxID=29729 RepID=UPI0022F18489|nr:probable glutathione S-transferase [Gossypium arboreum]
MLRRVKRILESEGQWWIRYVPREANSVADCLAKMSLEWKISLQIYENPPDAVLAMLQRDQSSQAFLQGNLIYSAVKLSYFPNNNPMWQSEWNPIIAKLYRTEGEEQQAVVKEWLEMLEAMEEHALIGGKKFFGGDEINMVDIAFCMVAHWLGVFEDAAGLKVFEPHKFPQVSSWIQNFKSVPIIKDNLPDTDKIVAYLKSRKEMLLTSKSN